MSCVLPTHKRLGTVGILVLSLLATRPSDAAPASMVSFTFDDGLASALGEAAPILARYGFTGTEYVITNCVGMATAPNTCAANTDATYLTWTQITALQKDYGWEIGSHTENHPALSTDKLTDAQLEAELAGSKRALNLHGFTATSFATPYGDYDPNVLAIAAKYYSNHRGFWDLGANVWPYSDYLVRVRQVQAGVTVAQVKGYIDDARSRKQWLVLVFHDIKRTPSSDPDDYQYGTADLDAIAAYVKVKNVPVVQVGQALMSSGANLLSNASFESGLAGWSTDAPTSVMLDSTSHGSYPYPTHSVSLTSAADSVHLFGPTIPVAADKTYLIKGFLRVEQLAAGAEIGLYVDEYDIAGKWISGQWKIAEKNVLAENLNVGYTPTSGKVKRASLQIYTTSGTGSSAYVDSFQWLQLN
jgi:peptidoglycan/xylan/chitin deacetylase (PgdA/CDA1 family)